MTRSILALVILILLNTVSLLAQSDKLSKGDAIIGEWTNPSKDAKFEIYKKDNKYFGKVIWGTGEETKDINNPDPKLRHRDLIGLIILQNFVFDGENSWKGGTIYDPQNGKTYSCELTLYSANQLDVRGYVGISLFGRTEIWTRI
jgi:uncharacterized protein (DUF2147 family)